MKPVDQTIFMDFVPEGDAETAVQSGVEAGNCLQACIASLHEVPIEEVPHFVQYLKHPAGTDELLWWWAIVGWCYVHGAIVSVVDEPPLGWGIVTGTSPRGHLHVCVTFDGKIVHDPHPSREGVIEEEWWSWEPFGEKR